MAMAGNMDESTIVTAAKWLKPSAALAQAARPAPLGESRSVRATVVRFGYRVGSLGFLVGPGVLSELLSTPEIYPIPNVPPALRGYVNRQGALVPVWDLRVLIGDHPEHDEAQDKREAILLLTRRSTHRHRHQRTAACSQAIRHSHALAAVARSAARLRQRSAVRG